jgi:glycosyltransferase involved in cell wall biosynthesis
MRIVLSNYRYFVSGGPEKYLFSIEKLFRNNNVDVFPFSVKSKKNVYSIYEKYFLSSIDSNDAVYFHQYDKDLITIIKLFDRSFYSIEGYLKAYKYAQTVKPDLVYSLLYGNRMSPSIIDGFKKVGIPVIARISDFGYLCPQPFLYCKNKICESCINGSIINCVKNKCVHSSLFLSLVKTMAMSFHKTIKVYKRIDAFVAPSKFTKDKHIEAGFPSQKIYNIPTFVETESIIPNYENNDFILYFGRFIWEKGLHVLLEAYDLIKGTKPDLLVVGDTGESDYSHFYIRKYRKKVKFIKFIPENKLTFYIKNSMFVVVPSLWYENTPNSVLESFANGKAVIASNIGCFPELINHMENGLLFDVGNIESLLKNMIWAIDNPKKMVKMGKCARKIAETNFSPKQHFNRLIDLFNKYI